MDVDENSILVLKGCGPKGYPGMPEVGNMALPKKLLEKGVVDMIRISDARMSGTAFGTVILHVAPESSIGGPLALIKTGDMIELDVEQRRLHLDVSDDILEKRRDSLVLEDPTYVRGYYRLYIDSVTQADKGADFSFLIGKSSHIITRESH